MKFYALLAAPLLIIGLSSAGFGYYDDAPDDYDAAKYKPQVSMQTFYETGNATANVLQMGSDYERNNKNYQAALKLIQQALKKEKNDIDIHMSYAQVMEEILGEQEDKDPKMVNKCIKEWLIVYRSSVGEEKGLSWHGLSLPGMQKRYEDEERSIPAAQHLTKMAGSLPKPNETDAKYLNRVLKPAEESVSGKLVSDAKATSKTKHGGKPKQEAQALNTNDD